MAIQPFKFYLKPEVSFKIIDTCWKQFCLLGGVIYLYHLLWTIAGVNAYADYTRHTPCGTITAPSGLSATAAQSVAYLEELSGVFDIALALSTIFHMIEWLRWTALLTTGLVGANLMTIYYALSINIPFGIITSIIAIITRYGDDGSLCAEAGKQENRAFYLQLQIVCLFVYIPTCFAHVIYLKIRGIDWCHAQFLYEEPEDDWIWRVPLQRKRVLSFVKTIKPTSFLSNRIVNGSSYRQ